MSDLHVVFGAGSLGSAVARRAIARGHRVKIASRSGKSDVTGAEGVRADATDAQAVSAACAGATAVYFCAAPPYTDWPRLLPPMQRGIIEGVAPTGARLVTAENVYVYGRVDGVMTEDTPWNPCSKKGELRAQLNREALDAHKAGKVRVALGRGPDYYGPGAVATTIYGEQVFPKALANKAANVFGELDKLHTWACADDFAAGLVTLGENAASEGQVWHVPCPPALTQREMLTLIYRACGHDKMKAQALPPFMLKVLGVFLPIMRELAEMDYQWRMTYDFRHEKFDKAFPGATPTPHERAIADTVAWFRTQGAAAR